METQRQTHRDRCRLAPVLHSPPQTETAQNAAPPRPRPLLASSSAPSPRPAALPPRHYHWGCRRHASPSESESQLRSAPCCPPTSGTSAWRRESRGGRSGSASSAAGPPPRGASPSTRHAPCWITFRSGRQVTHPWPWALAARARL